MTTGGDRWDGAAPLALALLIAAASPAPAGAAAEEPEEDVGPPPTSDEVLPPVEPCPEGWIARSRGAVGGALFSMVRRFDDAFGATLEDIEDAREDTYVRVGVDSFAAEGGRLDLGASVSARVRLPALERRLDRLALEITGRTDRVGPETPFTERDPAERRQPTPLLGFRRRAWGDAELRARVHETRNLYADVGVGTFLRLPPDTYLRARVQGRWPTGERLTGRLGLTGFVASDVGPGGTLRLVLQHAPARPVVLQWESEATYTRARTARLWGTQATASAAVSRSLAVAVGAAADGALWPEGRWEYARVFGRARTSFLRSWLFVELEPQLGFRPRPGAAASRTLGLVVRLEVVLAPEAPRCKEG